MDNSKIVYIYRNEAGVPSIQEEPAAPSAFHEALEFAKHLARTTAGFMLGQVLDSTGKVQATVCPGGVRLNEKNNA